jgi:hypothetical protein
LQIEDVVVRTLQAVAFVLQASMHAHQVHSSILSILFYLEFFRY